MGLDSTLSNGSIINAKLGKISLGKNVRIGNSTELVSAKNKTIQIKDFSTLYSNCKVLGQITIERYCVLATNIYMSSGNHFAFEHPELLIRVQDKLARENNVDINKPIHIHEDVWIGNGVFISPGITIGRGAVIGAGTILTKSVKPYNVVVGNPGKVIKHRLVFNPPTNLDSNNQVDWPYFYQGFNHWGGFQNKNNHGLELIDTGIVYISNQVKALSITGFTELDCTISIEVNNVTTQHNLSTGHFNINTTILESTKSEHLILTIIPHKELINNNIYINTLTNKTN